MTLAAGRELNHHKAQAGFFFPGGGGGYTLPNQTRVALINQWAISGPLLGQLSRF